MGSGPADWYSRNAWDYTSSSTSSYTNNDKDSHNYYNWMNLENDSNDQCAILASSNRDDSDDLQKMFQISQQFYFDK
jgi:hypothetical protein